LGDCFMLAFRGRRVLLECPITGSRPRAVMPHIGGYQPLVNVGPITTE
jgi:hypothetical protein